MALAVEILFALLAGLGLMAAARGFSRARNYGRAPALLANLIALGVSYFQFQAHLWLLAIPLSIASLTIVVLTLSLTPSTDSNSDSNSDSDSDSD